MAETFDENELLDRVGGDMGFLTEIVQMLQTDGRTTMKQIQDSLARGDAAAMGRAGHALKGIVSNFCAARTQACALAVEQMGKGGTLAGAPEAVNALETHLEALLVELAKYIAEKA